MNHQYSFTFILNILSSFKKKKQKNTSKLYFISFLSKQFNDLIIEFEFV